MLEYCASLDGCVEDRGGAGHVGLGNLPRLGLLEILVAGAGHIHRKLQCLAEVERLQRCAHLTLEAADLVEESGFGFGESTGFGHYTVEIFVDKNHGTVHEVAKDGNKLVVVAGLEVAPGEVVVFGLGGIGREDVAENVLLAGEVGQIFVEPHGPVAGGRDLVALKIEEFVGRDIVGQLEVVAVGHEHRRENDAVEHDIVLADEVDHSGLGIFPPLLPAVGQEFLRVGDIADRSDVAKVIKGR